MNLNRREDLTHLDHLLDKDQITLKDVQELIKMGHDDIKEQVKDFEPEKLDSVKEEMRDLSD